MAFRTGHMKRPAILRLIALLIGIVVASQLLAASPAWAQTRRAFLVGVNSYSDREINKLTRSVNDANDIGEELQDVGFDKKNIRILANPKNRAELTKAYAEFLKTVQPGDVVLVFFSGHGYGLQETGVNYLLTGDVKGLLTYTKSKLPPAEAKVDAVVRVKAKDFETRFEAEELPRAGVTETELRELAAQRQPSTLILILDACRDEWTTAGAEDTTAQQRSKSVSLQPVRDDQLEPGQFVFYSARPGQKSVERLSFIDVRRNSLFTALLRNALARPGFEIRKMAEHVSRQVAAVSAKVDVDQVPKAVHNLRQDFYFVGSIGAERNVLDIDVCRFAEFDLDEALAHSSRTRLQNHLSRYGACETAARAHEAIAGLGDGSEDSADRAQVLERRLRQFVDNRGMDACDRYAASDQDPGRPAIFPGIPFDRIGTETRDVASVIEACKTAVKDFPRTVRFVYNLARAYDAASRLPVPAPAKGATAAEQQALDQDRQIKLADRKRSRDLAVDRYQEAVRLGYVPALNNLAVFYDSGRGVPQDRRKAVTLWRQAAQQGLPIAMYNLAWKYRVGDAAADIQANADQAYEWFSRAADANQVGAMVMAAKILSQGTNRLKKSGKRAEELYLRAAEQGSLQAMVSLAGIYLTGLYVETDNGDVDTTSSVQPDEQRALIWASRAADLGSPDGQLLMAVMLEEGDGVPIPQPALAERYWQIAANSGNTYAQYNYIKRMHEGRLLVRENELREQNRTTELLERAIADGSSSAALLLAELYRNTNTLGVEVDKAKAIALAFKAIELAAQESPVANRVDPLTEIRAAHLIIAMARSGEAIDANGGDALSREEIERLEAYYGRYNRQLSAVRVNKLEIPDVCNFNVEVTRTTGLWVWDWERRISPTELQFRAAELREESCYANYFRTAQLEKLKNKKDRNAFLASLNVPTRLQLRGAFNDVFKQARDTKTDFADMLASRIMSAKNASNSAKATR